MDKQLEWITNLIDESHIQYWVDFGTLLTLVRDKELAEYDNDIDISIWWNDIKKIEKLIPVIKRQGYYYKWLRYKGIKYRLKLFPPKNSNLRVIDITVFFNSNDQYAWSPQRITVESNNILFKIMRAVIFYLWLIVPKEVKIDKFPLSIISYVYTWWIPFDHFSTIINSEDHRVNIPENFNKHLSLHYGNWKIPVKEWSFLHQDKALTHLSPENIINSSN